MEYLFYIIVALSIILNIALYLFVREILSRLLYVSDNIGNMQELLGHFSDHIEAVHSLETFYGDQTLQKLMEHSKMICIAIKDFDNITDLTAEDRIVEQQEEEIDGETS